MPTLPSSFLCAHLLVRHFWDQQELGAIVTAPGGQQSKAGRQNSLTSGGVHFTVWREEVQEAKPMQRFYHSKNKKRRTGSTYSTCLDSAHLRRQKVPKPRKHKAVQAWVSRGCLTIFTSARGQVHPHPIRWAPVLPLVLDPALDLASEDHLLPWPQAQPPNPERERP